jgi:hypothetical protein
MSTKLHREIKLQLHLCKDSKPRKAVLVAASIFLKSEIQLLYIEILNSYFTQDKARLL